MSSRLFWPLALIVMGVLFLLDNLGYLPGDAWGYIWPVALILLGLSVLLGWRAGPGEVVEDSLSLEGATAASVTFRYGAGQLDVRGGAAPGLLFDGEFRGGVDKHVGQGANGPDVVLAMRAGDWTFPWGWPGRRFEWRVRLASEPALNLVLETGASAATLDLSQLRVTSLRLQTGASSTRLVLPARAGYTRARVNSGAASVDITVPEGVAAVIHGQVSVGSLDVDRRRFPQRGAGYQSDDYEGAANRVELDIDGGVGSVRVH